MSKLDEPDITAAGHYVNRYPNLGHDIHGMIHIPVSFDDYSPYLCGTTEAIAYEYQQVSFALLERHKHTCPVCLTMAAVEAEMRAQSAYPVTSLCHQLVELPDTEEATNE